ncbi:MAG TPA: DUF2510 domain-containing protein [Chloroflexota bacterium]
MTDPAWPPPVSGGLPIPQQQVQQQTPATAQWQPGGLMLRTSFFPLAWVLYLCRPKVSIDGGPAFQVQWGDNPLPLVPPGTHRVRVWFRYLFYGDCGVADALVHVPEQGLFLEYKAPTWWMFNRGRFPALEQQAAAATAGAWHPDPTGRYEQRYWDGHAWTGHVTRAGQQGWDPA